MVGPNDTNKLLSRAYANFGQGGLSGALKLGKKILKIDPDHFEAHLLAGEIFVQRGKLALAKKHFGACVRIRPSSASAYFNLGLCLEKLHQLDKAMECYRKSSELDPSDPDPLYNLAYILKGLEEIGEAITLFRQCIEIDSTNPITHYSLAILLWETNQLDEAELLIRRAIDLDQNNITNHQFLGMVLTAKDLINQAADAFIASFKQTYRLNAPVKKDDLKFRKVHAVKLQHDIEQLEYLIDGGILSKEFVTLVQDYKNVLINLPNAPHSDIDNLFPSPSEQFKASYNRILHYQPPQEIPGGALNPHIDTAKIEASYFEQDYGFAAFDSFLKPEAFASLRSFFLESTLWFETNIPGEVGAALRHGICCPLLLQIARETKSAFPRIFKDIQFSNCWSYKFYSRNSGVPVHADDGKVSINFWLTPDEANLNPETGG